MYRAAGRSACAVLRRKPCCASRSPPGGGKPPVCQKNRPNKSASFTQLEEVQHHTKRPVGRPIARRALALVQRVLEKLLIGAAARLRIAASAQRRFDLLGRHQRRDPFDFRTTPVGSAPLWLRRCLIAAGQGKGEGHKPGSEHSVPPKRRLNRVLVEVHGARQPSCVLRDSSGKPLIRRPRGDRNGENRA